MVIHLDQASAADATTHASRSPNNLNQMEFLNIMGTLLPVRPCNTGELKPVFSGLRKEY